MWGLVLAWWVTAGSFALGGKLWERRQSLQIWHKAAVRRGLQIEESSGVWAWRIGIKARTGVLDVSIEESRNQERGALIVAEIPGPPGFLGLTLRSQPLNSSQATTREIETGDPQLRSRFFITGPHRLSAALLDAETRRLLIQVNEMCQLSLVHGQLQAETTVDQTDYVLPLLLAFGRRIAEPADAIERLAENARKDPEAGVRLHNLHLLARELPGDPKTVETLRAACSDGSPLVRLCAAKNLGAEGRGVLLKLAESLEDDAVSAEAVSLLGPALPPESTREILAQALRRRHLQTARACLEHLAQSGDPSDIDVLVKVLARETGELAVAAVTALGHLGTTAAVLPLKEAAERNPHDHDLLKATRQAIAEIQSRLPGASPGQLSLASSEAGSLSLAPAAAGQLSIVGDAVGRLDLDEIRKCEEG